MMRKKGEEPTYAAAIMVRLLCLTCDTREMLAAMPRACGDDAAMAADVDISRRCYIATT